MSWSGALASAEPHSLGGNEAWPENNPDSTPHPTPSLWPAQHQGRPYRLWPFRLRTVEESVLEAGAATPPRCHQASTQAPGLPT